LTILEFGVDPRVNHGKRFMATSRESILQMVSMGRADGSMEYFDQHLLDYAGLPAEDLRGWGWLKLIHPEDASLA
jgi:PAS domain-containing protein